MILDIDSLDSIDKEKKTGLWDFRIPAQSYCLFFVLFPSKFRCTLTSRRNKSTARRENTDLIKIFLDSLYTWLCFILFCFLSHSLNRRTIREIIVLYLREHLYTVRWKVIELKENQILKGRPLQMLLRLSCSEPGMNRLLELCQHITWS